MIKRMFRNATYWTSGPDASSVTEERTYVSGVVPCRVTETALIT